MIEMLTVELERRLLLNATNTKVSTACGTNDACHVEVMGSMLEVLHGTATHKYLGRLLVGQLKRRSEDEISHCLQVAWAKFHKYKHVLAKRHVSWKLRLKSFDSMISPAAPLGLTSLPSGTWQIQGSNME